MDLLKSDIKISAWPRTWLSWLAQPHMKWSFRQISKMECSSKWGNRIPRIKLRLITI